MKIKTSNTAFQLNSMALDALDEISMASVNVFCIPFIKRKVKDVLQVSSVSESVGTALLVTNWQKNNLFREVDDVNPNAKLAELESYILESANKLGIGTMGFGGEATLLGCKVGVMHRIPASFYVSVAYNCWAYRRMAVDIDAKTGEITHWHYNDGEKIAFTQEDTLQNEVKQSSRTVELTGSDFGRTDP